MLLINSESSTERIVDLLRIVAWGMGFSVTFPLCELLNPRIRRDWMTRFYSDQTRTRHMLLAVPAEHIEGERRVAPVSYTHLRAHET